jgi:beta-lysine 5,6-aminomutase beta subunit
MTTAPHWIAPYGDTLDDGRVQLSLTLPVPHGDEAREAALQLALQMGLEQPAVVHGEAMGPDFSFFILYARSPHRVDFSRIQVTKPEFDALDKAAIDLLIADTIGRKLVVIGACIETDAHTVGIDAIMNMKGYNGHKGLESYHHVRALNLGAQVTSEELVARAIRENADVILVSQVVTQKDIHLDNLNHLHAMLTKAGLRDKVILVAGGPRINHELARDLGYDAGFGPGSYAEDVASFAIHEWIRRHAHQRRPEGNPA